MSQFLGIRNWSKYQPGRKGTSPWIKDWTDKESDAEYMRLTGFQRYILDGCRRLRGKFGRNLPNDADYVARALQVTPKERHCVPAAIRVLTTREFLVVTDQQLDFVDKEKEIEKEVEKERTKDLQESPAKQPRKQKAVRPETSSGLKAVILLPLNSGEEFPIEEKDFERWKTLYPAVNVLQELRKMAGWLDSHPAKRKTRGGVKAFVNRWLSRAQDDPKAAEGFKVANGQVSKSQQRNERNNEKYRRVLGILPEGTGGDLSLRNAGSGIGLVPGISEHVSTERSETGRAVIDGESDGRMERNSEATGLHPPNTRAKGTFSRGD